MEPAFRHLFGFILSFALLFSSSPAFGDETTKDHLSDSSVWQNQGIVTTQSLGPNQIAYIASTFAGTGQNLSRVAALFSNSLVTGLPNTTNWWTNYDFIIMVNKLSNLNSDPTFTGAGATRIVLPEPNNVMYRLPIGTTLANQKPFNVLHFEFDLSPFNIGTAANTTYVIAITPVPVSGGSGSLGYPAHMYSNGNGSSIGTTPDYYYSNVGVPVGPDTLTNLSLPLNNVAYKVVLENPNKPYFSIESNGAFTLIRLQNNPIFGAGGLNLNTFSWTVGSSVIDWNGFLGLVGLFPNNFFFNPFGGPTDEFEIYVQANLTGINQQFAMCDTGTNPTCHSTP